MSNNKKVSGPTPGVGPTKVFTTTEVRDFVKRDINAAIMCLDAIYKDPNTLDALADYLHGRYMNAKHSEELAKQSKLEV